MKVELKEEYPIVMSINDINTGDVFVAMTNDEQQKKFIAMKVNAFTMDSDANPYILDMETGNIYDDIDNYVGIRVLNCKLVEEDEVYNDKVKAEDWTF